MEHILFIVQNNSFPSDNRVRKEANVLHDAGYAVTVISPSKGDDVLPYEIVNGIHVRRYRHWEATGGIHGFLVEYTNALARIIYWAIRIYSQKRYRAIHVANPPDFFWVLALLFRPLGVKFIFDQHDISSEMYRINEQKDKNLVYRFLNWNERMTIRLAHGVIATNTSILNRLQRLYQLNRKHCVVVYNSPTTNFVAQRDEEVVSRYKGRRVLLYIGEMAPLDCVDVVIEAAARIVKNHGRTDCTFVLLGDGRERPRLESMAHEEGLSDVIEFRGMVSQDTVMKYLYVAEICLVPDRPNGLNEYLTLVKTLEYMKAGKPFVSFALKETQFLAQSCAVFVEDMAGYVSAIIRLLDDPIYAKEMGRRGQERVEKDLSWSIQATELLALYERVLMRHSPFVEGERQRL